MLIVINDMFNLTKESIEEHATVKNFIFAEGSLHGLVSEDVVKQYWMFDVESKYDKSKKPSFSIFDVCALLGLKRHLTFLIQEFDISDVLKFKRYRTFRLAVENGRLDIFNQLLDIEPDNIDKYISPYNYMIFRIAVKNAHVEIVKQLLTLANTQKHVMVVAHKYEALKIALEEGHPETLNLLLSLPFVFTYAIKDRRYTTCIDSFIEAFIESLDKQQLMSREPALIRQLDLTPDKINTCIEIIKYLVEKLNEMPSTRDKIVKQISVLLAIPCVKERANTLL